MKKEVLLLIPAYNEEKNIGNVLDEILSGDMMELIDVLVIDDGSRDSTRQVAIGRKVKVISQIYNMGYGAALQTGYKYAVNKNYSYLIQMDADGQHDLKNISRIYYELKTGESHPHAPDIVIGSRYLEQEVKYKMSGVRMLAVNMFRKIIKLATKQKITDPTSGLQGLNRKAFSYYAGFSNFDIKYPDINMILQMLLLGFKIREIPAVMHERSDGVAMHSGIIKPFVYMILMSISTINVMIRFYKNRKIV